MNAEISVFVICVEAIIYLLLYNLHDCTFKIIGMISSRNDFYTYHCIVLIGLISSGNPYK